MKSNPPQSFNELEQWLNQRRVTEIECLVPDLTGVARGKICRAANSPKTAACGCRRRWWPWA